MECRMPLNIADFVLMRAILAATRELSHQPFLPPTIISLHPPLLHNARVGHGTRAVYVTIRGRHLLWGMRAS